MNTTEYYERSLRDEVEREVDYYCDMLQDEDDSINLDELRHNLQQFVIWQKTGRPDDLQEIL